MCVYSCGNYFRRLQKINRNFLWTCVLSRVSPPSTRSCFSSRLNRAIYSYSISLDSDFLSTISHRFAGNKRIRLRRIRSKQFFFSSTLLLPIFFLFSIFLFFFVFRILLSFHLTPGFHFQFFRHVLVSSPCLFSLK